MMFEFKLLDGTLIYADNEVYNKLKINLANNSFTTTSLLSVVCVKSKEHYVFSMSNVIYAKTIEELPDSGFSFG
jgi:hypothetical protein